MAGTMDGGRIQLAIVSGFWMLPPKRGMDPSTVIQYLRACYEADNREGSVLDLRQEKIQHLTFLSKGADFMSGALPVTPVDRDRAVEAQKAAELFATEKTLIFGAFMLTGAITTPRGAGELCAPLYIIPARVREEGDYAVLEIDTSHARLNIKALAALRGDVEGGMEEGLHTLLAEAPMPPFHATARYDLASLLQAAVPGIDTACLLGRAQPGMEMPGAGGPPRCHNLFVMALLPNSVDTRGALSELARLAATQGLSPPLRRLLGGAGAEPARGKPWRAPALLPASLTPAQSQAVLAARSAPLALLVGPPGTGKTFTLAALVADHAIHGRSTLIAARTEEALDALESKLRHFVGPDVLLIRGGRGDALRPLKEGLQRLLSGHDPVPPPATRAPRLGLLLHNHRMLRRQKGRVERDARTVAKLGEIDARRANSGALALWWGRARAAMLERRLRRAPSLTGLLLELRRNGAALREGVRGHLSAALARKVAAARGRRRQMFVKLNKAIRSRTRQRLDSLYDSLPLRELLHTFPIWLCPVADLNNLLPLQAGIFDLAVVDEATQADMASCLPVFQRARRVVVSGDHRQLRHVSFLPAERQRQLARRFAPDGSDAWASEFDFRNHSLLDLLDAHLASQEDLVFLDEHHRGEPELIAFSNAEFYAGKLKVMKWRAAPSPTPPPLSFAAVGGSRSPKGHNAAEARALIDELARLIQAEAGLPPGAASSIGILSPLRRQVDHLEQLVAKTFDLAQIRKHHLLVGTAHGFQGAERDIMLLSLAIGAEEGGGALRFISRPDVFNVSITRARRRQIVFHSLRAEDLPAGHLIRRYLESRPDPEIVPAAADPSKEPFRSEVAAALREAGWEIRPARRIAGICVDLLLLRGEKGVALLLSASPSADATPPFEDLETLERAGLAGLWLTRREWTHAKESFLALLNGLHGPVPCETRLQTPSS